ncbi:hypothetical protein Pcaca03_28740 [Pectobacterium carotovorum subsp. carotovorum]|uniref:Uncharacterized protein n=1 Tax=Pectobacterium carotovorum subsp. carotovorum TaxID=555 RepID=A0AAI9PFG2_PECCC|nr:hypothetical protein SOASR016_27380 [Pectobacterium carotovorum subsp. carotovorum]GLV70430.1 hypothetical protein Pcaca03_28740 [Pectobacterium carotovorum subsp. carotovorum]
MPPQAIENEFRTGVPVDDFVIEDAKAVTQPKPINLDFQQRIHRFFDFVLDLACTEKAQRVIVRQKYCDAGCIP